MGLRSKINGSSRAARVTFKLCLFCLRIRQSADCRVISGRFGFLHPQRMIRFCVRVFVCQCVIYDEIVHGVHKIHGVYTKKERKRK